MRNLSWVIATVVLLISLVLLWPRDKAAPVHEPLVREVSKQLATAPEKLWPEILAELENRLGFPSVQVFLAQGVPNQRAIVLAVPHDSSEDEQASHWESPWPALNRVLADGPEHSCRIADRWQSLPYLHHVFPVDQESRRYLIVTSLDARNPTMRWLGCLGLCLSAGMFIILFWFGRGSS